VAAPNSLLTGFHAVDVKNFINPNLPMASEDSLTRTSKIPTIKIMIANEATAVTEENNRS
jgi:hypothetical protein